ncbi:MAG: YifB family Mg chelatase-like AAA ATPase [Defluviitaleaceae bacterium]|nr:YifB family Mg chelatase-like AAA ATPase [Defluviitaleaceae bacterium]MCL2262455.1 YifB family Mg chelatase-like AAA ATPase [Defluviitaleaceae bacterium]
MFVRVTSGAVFGVESRHVDVEVDLSSGLPVFDIVGLPDSAVKESRERIRAAIRNAGYSFPVKRITVNLAPADIKKSGPAFDLPMAVGILMCMGLIKQAETDNSFFAGELSLDGALRPVNGILPMVMEAKAGGASAFFVSAENAAEAALVEGATVYPVTHITQLVQHFTGTPIEPLHINTTEFFGGEGSTYDVDFSDVAGQTYVKRALEIAAAGYHNALMIGTPGAGKTMLARRMPTILPNLSMDESMEITKIYSIAGLLNQKNLLMAQRPFRTPHHTASHISLTGGGRIPSPGEISLAHNGVLFLDELPEFQKKALETLRQPLEDGQITITRANGVSTYPSVFLLLAAMNPCPCGYLGTKRCSCSDAEISRYLEKISGPLLDRIDIQVEATPVDYTDLQAPQTPAENSAAIKARVENARTRQQFRFANDPKATGIRFNAKMSAALIKKHCKPCKEAQDLLKSVFDTMALSARAYHKILKISRTIADLADSHDITAEHMAEAISYRGLDRKYW